MALPSLTLGVDADRLGLTELAETAMLTAKQPKLEEESMAVARVTTREGDPEEMERQYGVVAGRMNEMPLADGLIAHIALRRPNGIQVINVWESEEQSQAAFERPEFQEALREAGMSPSEIQPETFEVLDIRTS